MRRLLLGGVAVLLLFLGGACRQQDDSFEQKVKQALTYQMREYPESTLKDVYKNFFQDRYGPGHLLSDTAAAGAYLRRELASYTEITGPYFEPTGWEGNFYRVNLSVIKQQLVPYEDFFSAFVRSVQGITPVPVSEWKEEWGRILQIIEREYPSMAEFENDRRDIAALLDSGGYVVHHSPNFEKRYAPHYRIIEKSIFEAEILPRLP